MPKTNFPIPAGFRCLEGRNAFLVVRQDMADAVRKALGPFHHAWTRFNQRRFTAQGRAGIVTLPLEGDLAPMMVRKYVHGGLFAPLGRNYYLGPFRAIMELTVTEAAQRAGVKTPVTVGVFCEQVQGPLWRLAYLSAEVPDSEDLVHYCCRLADYPAETAAAEKRGAIREAAQQIRKMHDAGIRHADLHLKNLLLRRRESGTPEVYVIDFDKAQLGPSLDTEQRLGNLKRLARSVRKVRVADSVLTAWDRIRFVRNYLRGRPEAGPLLRQWVRRLRASGAGHEVWWTVSGGKKRDLRGDRVGRLSSYARLK